MLQPCLIPKRLSGKRVQKVMQNYWRFVLYQASCNIVELQKTDFRLGFGIKLKSLKTCLFSDTYKKETIATYCRILKLNPFWISLFGSPWSALAGFIKREILPALVTNSNSSNWFVNCAISSAITQVRTYIMLKTQ